MNKWGQGSRPSPLRWWRTLPPSTSARRMRLPDEPASGPPSLGHIGKGKSNTPDPLSEHPTFSAP